MGCIVYSLIQYCISHMKIIRISQLPFIAASHEDPADPGSLKKVLFTIRDFPRNGTLQMINWAKIEPGKAFRKHYHEDMDEVFIVISGAAKIVMDGEEERLQAGDAVLIPAHCTHTMENIEAIDMEYLVVGVSQGSGGKTVLA